MNLSCCFSGGFIILVVFIFLILAADESVGQTNGVARGLGIRGRSWGAYYYMSLGHKKVYV